MAMSGGTSYLVRSKYTDYGNNPWAVDLYIYVKLLSQDDINNQSLISLGMYVYSKYEIDWTDWGTNGTSYVGTATSGANCFTFRKGASGSGTYWLTENHEVTVAHKSDGTAMLPIYWHWGVNSPWGQYQGPSGSVDVTITAIDRTAPTVSCATTVDSSTGMTIKATASATCDKWEYSLDGGSTWTEYSTTSGTTASKTLTGLTSEVYFVKVRARKSTNHIAGTSGTVSTDLVAPTVSISVSNIMANSIYINATSDVNCDKWEYSLDGGSTWTEYSTTSGTTATKTISDLSPNTEYAVKVRARKKSNLVKSASATKTAKTLGGTIINSVSTLTVDESSPVIQMNWTVYNASYSHKLVIKNGSTTILTIEGLTGSAGTINKTYTLTTGQTTTILDAMANLANFTATYELTTYDDSAQIGTVSSYNAKIQTTSTNSKPTFVGFTFADINEVTLALTENDQLMVQSHSSLQVSCGIATAKNGARIAKYRVTIGSKTVESETAVVDFGEIGSSGSVTVTVSAVDSRGYTATKTQTVTVLPYKHIKIDYWSIRRINEVEEATNFSFKGAYSPLVINGVEKNYLKNVVYRYRMTSGDEWSNWETIEHLGSGGIFEYVNNEFGWFDSDYSYEICLCAADQITSCTVYLSLPKGTPLVAYRSKMLGINNNQPTSALDVVGEIKQNGEGVLGMVGILDADFDTFFTSGIYWYAASSALDNAPSQYNGFLLVLSLGVNTIHLFTDGTTLYTRSYNPSTKKWSLWVGK